VTAWPPEPVLALNEIQGMALPGFAKRHQRLLFFSVSEARIGRLKDFLKAYTQDAGFDAAHTVLADRRLARKRPPSQRSEHQAARAFAGIGFNHRTLVLLAPSAQAITSVAFKLGMPARSRLLGDPDDPGDPGHPARWKVGGTQSRADVMVVVAGDSSKSVQEKRDDIVWRLDALEIRPLEGWTARDEVGERVCDAAGAGCEHFGFADGVSQPGIRGRASDGVLGDGSPDYVTPRTSKDWPDSALFGLPGQDLVWPGEFILGYPKTGPDPLRPGVTLAQTPDWMRNGSYLVYRRLEQDVPAFWSHMRREAALLSDLDGFGSLDEVALAARLVGRWPDGTPLVNAPGPTAPPGANGTDPLTANAFRFAEDPLGQKCPLGAHIRRINPRDTAADMGGASANLEHRILRVGIPFGEKHPQFRGAPPAQAAGAGAGDEKPRGQHFVCIQASIENQFEFLQARWMNDERRPTPNSGHDMVAGQVPASRGGVRRCPIRGEDGKAVDTEARRAFVTVTGGGYFFVPSIKALSEVLAAG
jgi:Dyp-type peroxidase family